MGLVGDLGFAIRRALFGDGEQGMWYDLNDLSTLFTDSAGTTPATWGDPIGLQLDKHDGLAVSPELVTDGSFTNGAAGWTLDAGVTIADQGGGDFEAVFTASGANTELWRAPVQNIEVGTYRVTYTITSYTAGTFRPNVAGIIGTIRSSAGTFTELVHVTSVGAQRVGIRGLSASNTARVDDISIVRIAGNHRIQSTAGSRPILGRMPKRGRINELVATATMATQNVTVTNAQRTLSFTGTGTVTLSGVSTAGPLVGTGVSNRVSLTFTPTAGTLTLTVTGSVTLSQLQLGAAFDNYQAVGATAFDITESGQPSCGYLSYNGSNQWMQTAAAVNFSATDEMSVFAGVRKVSDAARGVIAELTTSIAANNGAFNLTAPNAASATYAFESKGTTLRDAVATPFTAPIFNVLSGVSDISGDSALIRVNGTQADVDTGDQGTGNYANAVTYFGARAGTSLYFNGLEFSTIIRGALTSGTLLTRTEQYVARQTPTVNL
jgi:hypothetical protein